MRVSAKSEYAIRAAAYLAAANGSRVKAEELSDATLIPRQFLENILGELRRAGIVRATRGAEGGYELARPANAIELGMVLAAVGSSLADNEVIEANGNGDGSYRVDDVWLALQSLTRTLLEQVTLADVVAGKMPTEVRRLARKERARRS
jgi:Rrf2 family protein